MDNQPLYFAVGINAIKQQVMLLYYDDDPAKCLKDAEEELKKQGLYEDVAYLRAFNLMEKDFPETLGNWIISCGVPHSTAVETMRDIGKSIAEIFEIEL